MSHDLEAEPIDQGDPPAPAATPITAAMAAREGALARWSTEFVTRYALDHPDAASPAQAAQQVRAAGEIR